MNLCTNAFHAMRKKGGLLEISLTDEEVKSKKLAYEMKLKPGNYVKLTIGDTGEGIDPEIIDRIFDPYFTTKPPGKGTGVGLSLVLGIIKKLNGNMTVKSQKSKGSTFTIFIPKLKKTDAHGDVFPTEKMATGKETILIADDEKEIVRVSEKILKSLGYTVIACANGMETLNYFKKEPDKIDLVITDQTMPGMTGAQLAKELLSIKPHLPIILWTGFTDRISEKEAISIGIRKFIMKPITRSVLARTIRSVLDLDTPGQKIILNLTDILENLYLIISTLFNKNITFTKKWPETLLMEGNQSELNLALMNLFLNANEAMPEGGLLHIEAREEKSDITIIVSDTGCGMSDDIQKKMYLPFFTTKNDHTRPGLGMPMVKSIINNHQGKISVQSEPDRGTTFQILFPKIILDDKASESFA
jgi:signal transduction histidine kinase